MFLPIGDTPNPPQSQKVNLALIAINVAVFIFVSWPLTGRAPSAGDPEVLEYLRIMSHELRVSPSALFSHASAYDIFVFTNGFRPADPSLATLFSSMFLHAGWLHLLGNMLFLWIFGDNVEYHLGSARYLIVYLVTGAAGTLAFALFRLDSHTPLVGASGAISGVLGCYFVWFPRNRVRVLMVLIWFIDILSIPARWVLGFYVIIENLLPFVFGSAGSVAYGAHLGGFVGGVFCASAVDFLRRGGNAMGAGSATPSPHSPAASAPARLAEDIAAGRFDSALADYAAMALDERRRTEAADVFALADWLTKQGRMDSALAVLQRFIASNPTHRALDRAHLRAGLILLRGVGRPTAAYQHLLTVLDLEPSSEVEQEARSALGEIERSTRRRRLFH